MPRHGDVRVGDDGRLETFVAASALSPVEKMELARELLKDLERDAAYGSRVIGAVARLDGARLSMRVRPVPLRRRVADWFANRKRTSSTLTVDGVRVYAAKGVLIEAVRGACGEIVAGGGTLTIDGPIRCSRLGVPSGSSTTLNGEVLGG